MKPIAQGRIAEVGNIEVHHGYGEMETYRFAALVVFDSADTLRKAMEHGAIDAPFRPASREGNGND